MKVVCIPSFNEELTIGEIVKKSLQYADKVIVCDDGSNDNTANVARKNGAVVVSHQKNTGYGTAIITLFETARKEKADIMITLDGDGQHNPDQIPNLVNALVGQNLDLVVGSRFLDRRNNIHGYRKRGIKIITSASNMGTDFKLSDAQSGFRAYSKKAIDVINPTEGGMAVSTEIILKASNNKLSVGEVPISVSYRNDTSTHNPVQHGVSVLLNTLKFISVKHPISFYGFPGIAFIIVGSVMGYNFLDAYLQKHVVFLGSLAAAIILFLFGAILWVTAIILFSMSTLIGKRE